MKDRSLLFFLAPLSAMLPNSRIRNTPLYKLLFFYEVQYSYTALRLN